MGMRCRLPTLCAYSSVHIYEQRRAEKLEQATAVHCNLARLRRAKQQSDG